MNRSRNLRKGPALLHHRSLILLFFGIGLTDSVRAHEHLAAGAMTSEAGAALVFVNAARFAAESGYVIPLELATNGPYAGYHHAELTFVCQPATPDRGGPAPFHPVPGTRVEAVVESAEGPVGGEFGFWESPGEEETATQLTFSIPVGELSGARRFPVSENDGSPDADPYGHIHGRVFSATVPGLYRVGFRFVDTAGNGPNGGPLHPSSERFHLHFQAGITLAGIAEGTSGPELQFAAANDYRYVLESSPSLSSPAVWTPVGDPVVGDNHLHSLMAPPVDGAQFYRLRREAL